MNKYEKLRAIVLIIGVVVVLFVIIIGGMIVIPKDERLKLIAEKWERYPQFIITSNKCASKTVMPFAKQEQKKGITKQSKTLFLSMWDHQSAKPANMPPRSGTTNMREFPKTIKVCSASPYIQL